MVAATRAATRRPPTESRSEIGQFGHEPRRRLRAAVDCPTTPPGQLRGPRSRRHEPCGHRRQRRLPQVGPRRTGGSSPASSIGSARGPLRNNQRLAHQRIEQVEHFELVGVTRSRPPRTHRRGRNRPRRPNIAGADLFRPGRAGRTTRPPCDATSDAAPDHAATRPTTGNVDRVDPAPPRPSSTPSAMPPTRWPTEYRPAGGRSRPPRTLRRGRPTRNPRPQPGRDRQRDPLPQSRLRRRRPATEQPAGARRRGRALRGWSPEFAPSSTAPGSCRSTRPPRHEGAHSCRGPTAASCPPSPRRCSPPWMNPVAE